MKALTERTEGAERAIQSAVADRTNSVEQADSSYQKLLAKAQTQVGLKCSHGLIPGL